MNARRRQSVLLPIEVRVLVGVPVPVLVRVPIEVLGEVLVEVLVEFLAEVAIRVRWTSPDVARPYLLAGSADLRCTPQVPLRGWEESRGPEQTTSSSEVAGERSPGSYSAGTEGAYATG